nr:hypothetical protein GCM10020092_035590 [Actinoplanes digitatis]
MTAPLTDIRVIETGTLLAGPFCGQLLGDFGAEVIKLEEPGKGDPMRQWGREKPHGQSLWWPVVARNKKSVTCNLRTSEGQDLVRRLVAESDVLLENFRPGTLERWGLSYETLSEINPRLILVRVTGYGQTGPYAPRAGFGSIGEAMGGLRYVTGEPDRPPSRSGISIGDSLAATYAAFGTLAALHARERTGRGQVVDSAIYEAVMAMTESLIPEWAVAGYRRERTGAILPNVAPSNGYPTADGSDVLIAANQDTVFRRLATLMGLARAGRRPPLRHARRARRAPGRARRPGRAVDLRAAGGEAARTAARGRRPRRRHLHGRRHPGRPARACPRGGRDGRAPDAGPGADAERRAASLRDARRGELGRAVARLQQRLRVRRTARPTRRGACAAALGGSDLSMSALDDDYAAAGFARRLGWGTHPAVLLVDAALAYTSPGSPLYLSAGQAAAGAMEALAEAARAAALPVVWTRVHYADESCGEAPLFAAKVPALKVFAAEQPARRVRAAALAPARRAGRGQALRQRVRRHLARRLAGLARRGHAGHRRILDERVRARLGARRATARVPPDGGAGGLRRPRRQPARAQPVRPEREVRRRRRPGRGPCPPFNGEGRAAPRQSPLSVSTTPVVSRPW